jgi:hypothetical protein
VRLGSSPVQGAGGRVLAEVDLQGMDYKVWRGAGIYDNFKTVLK